MNPIENDKTVNERFQDEAKIVIDKVIRVALAIEKASGISHSEPTYGNWSVGYAIQSPTEERKSIIDTAINNLKHSISAPFDLFLNLAGEHGLYTNSNRQLLANSYKLFDIKTVNNFQYGITSKIEQYASSSNPVLLDNPNLGYLLIKWKEISDGNSILESFLEKAFSNNSLLINIMKSFVGTMFSSDKLKKLTFQEKRYFNLKSFSKLFDITRCASKIRKLYFDSDYFKSLKKEDQEIIEIFLGTVDGEITAPE